MVLAKLKHKSKIIEILSDGNDLLKVETLKKDKVTDIEYILLKDMEKHIEFLQHHCWELVMKRELLIT